MLLGRDEEALKHMLEEKGLTLEKVVDICQASENAVKISAVIRGEGSQGLAKVYRPKEAQTLSY